MSLFLSRLRDLVVGRSPRERKTRVRFPLSPGDFFFPGPVIPVKTGAQVGTLLGVGRCRVSAETGWSGVSYRLVGLVVEASASREEDPGFESHL